MNKNATWAHANENILMRSLGNGLMEVIAENAGEMVQIRLDIGEKAAKLMIAAPELLQELKRLENKFGVRGDGWPNPEWDAAREIIAKATGAQP